MNVVTPYSSEWLKARKRYLGASEVAALWGAQAAYAPSLYTLFHIKRGDLEDPNVDGERPAWGRRLEDAIAEGAAETYGWTLRPGTWVPDDESGIAATIDRYIVQESRIAEILETKNTDWLVHRKTWTDDEPPIFIQLQLQAQLAVTRLPIGHIVPLIGGNHLEKYTYPRNDRIIDEMRERAREFWRDVKVGKEPPADGSQSTADTLKALWPEAVLGKQYDATEDMAFWDEIAKLKDATERRKAAEKEERAAKAFLAQRMADAEAATVNGAVIATYKTVSRTGYTVKPTTYRQFALKESD